MNYISTDAHTVMQFPENISFEYVPGYLNILGADENIKHICFDLSGTELIHSSFVGFMIHAKSIIERNEKQLTIILSRKAEYIFRLLGIYSHFQPNIIAM